MRAFDRVAEVIAQSAELREQVRLQREARAVAPPARRSGTYPSVLPPAPAEQPRGVYSATSSPALSQPRAKHLALGTASDVKAVTPLRGGDGPSVERPNRKLSPPRIWARSVEQPILAKAFAASSVSDDTIANAIGSRSGNKKGAEVKAGSTPLTAGEVALLLPLAVSGCAMVSLLRERLGRELAAIHPMKQANVRMMLCFLDQIEALFGASNE